MNEINTASVGSSARVKRPKTILFDAKTLRCCPSLVWRDHKLPEKKVPLQRRAPEFETYEIPLRHHRIEKSLAGLGKMPKVVLALCGGPPMTLLDRENGLLAIPFLHGRNGLQLDFGFGMSERTALSRVCICG